MNWPMVLNDVGCTLSFLLTPQRAARLEGLDRDHGAELVLFDHDVPPLEGLKACLEKGGGAETALAANGS